MPSLDDYRQQILAYIKNEEREFTHEILYTCDDWPEFTETFGDNFVQFDWNSPAYPITHAVGVSIYNGEMSSGEITYLLLSPDGSRMFDGHLPLISGSLAMLVAYIIENAPKKG
jgi:hypothetical protein